MSNRNRWKIILILLKFLQEADDRILVRVAEYAAKEMAP